MLLAQVIQILLIKDSINCKSKYINFNPNVTFRIKIIKDSSFYNCLSLFSKCWSHSNGKKAQLDLHIQEIRRKMKILRPYQNLRLYHFCLFFLFNRAFLVTNFTITNFAIDMILALSFFGFVFRLNTCLNF